MYISDTLRCIYSAILKHGFTVSHTRGGTNLTIVNMIHKMSKLNFDVTIGETLKTKEQFLSRMAQTTMAKARLYERLRGDSKNIR